MTRRVDIYQLYSHQRLRLLIWKECLEMPLRARICSDFRIDINKIAFTGVGASFSRLSYFPVISGYGTGSAFINTGFKTRASQLGIKAFQYLTVTGATNVIVVDAITTGKTLACLNDDYRISGIVALIDNEQGGINFLKKHYDTANVCTILKKSDFASF